MTASVFTDLQRGAALLVSDDPIYALGPVMVADDIEEAIEAMMAFIAALERDPSEMPTIALMVEWQGFLGAITGTVVAVPLDAQEPQDDQVDTQAGESSPGTLSGPTPPGGGAEDVPALSLDGSPAEDHDDGDPEAAGGGATPSTDDEDEDEDDDDELDMAGRLAHIPGGTPKQRGQIECFACGGTGHAIGQPETRCNLCLGKGKIDEPEPAQATTTTEDAE